MHCSSLTAAATIRDRFRLKWAQFTPIFGLRRLGA